MRYGVKPCVFLSKHHHFSLSLLCSLSDGTAVTKPLDRRMKADSKSINCILLESVLVDLYIYILRKSLELSFRT